MSLLLFLHIAGVVMLLGNALTAAFWKIRADATGDVRQAYQAAKNVMMADYIFTLPAIALILISGHLLAYRAGYEVFSWNWLGLSYGMFVLSGVIWLVVLLPAQYRMIRQGKISCEQGAATKEFLSASRLWNLFGTVATLLPVAALIFMIWKPEL